MFMFKVKGSKTAWIDRLQYVKINANDETTITPAILQSDHSYVVWNKSVYFEYTLIKMEKLNKPYKVCVHCQ